jgi:hemerythrin-like domain-containing protein
MSVEDIKAVNLPEIAKFPDRESCVAAHVKEGLSEAATKKICGHFPSKQSLRKVSFAYQATFEPYEEQGKHLAKIHVIDLAPNLNKWQVTPAARAKALKTLLDSPLLGPPPEGEKGNVIGGPPGSPHEGLWSPVGHFVDFESNHVTHGIAEITKDYAWEKIKNGEWSAVSPSVLAFLEHQEGDVAVVDDFNFEHVLFVDKGAYPEAGVESTYDAGFYQALATAAEKQAFSITDQDLSVMEKAVQSARGILTALEERLEIILGGKPDAEPPVQPLPLSSHNRVSDGEMSPVRPSPSPNQTQGLENKLGQKMEGGNEMKTTQASFGDASFPDECFAYVPPEAKGQDGKKSLRSLPYKNSDGSVDEGHLRNALARFNQTDIPSAGKAGVLSKLCSAAKKAGIDSDFCKEHSEEMHQSKEEQTLDNELQAKVTTLEAANVALKTENESLKAYKAEVEKKQRMAKVQSIVDLKTHCGMLDPKDHAQAYVDLEKLSADALDAIEKELTAVRARFDSMPSGPKAKHTAEEAYNTVEDIRQAMFGYRRDEKGQIIGGN